jgi:hypothetical protein
MQERLRTNNGIKLHNLKGELRFLVTLDPEFKPRSDFWIDAIERCVPGWEVAVHDIIKIIISEKHEQIRISQITG